MFSIVGLLLMNFGCAATKKASVETDQVGKECAKRLEECKTASAALDKTNSQMKSDLSSCGAAREKAVSDLRKAEELLSESKSAAEKAKADAKGMMTREEDLFAEKERELRKLFQDEIAQKEIEIERLKDELHVRLVNRIIFDSGSAKIHTDGKMTLDAVAGVLKDGNEAIRVEGHTDNVPIGEKIRDKYATNWELSSARATSVVRYFQTKHAVAPERMEAVGLAEYRSIAPNNTPENKQRNRRVEIILTKRTF